MHTHSCSQPTVRPYKSKLFFLSPPILQCVNHRRLSDSPEWIGYSSHLSCHRLGPSQKTVCQCVCAISRLVCLIVSFYGITALVTTGPWLTDASHTHTHIYIYIYIQSGAGLENCMLSGITVIADNIKRAGSSQRLHVAWIIMRPPNVPDI